jgi:hypothetical protein
MYYYRNSGNGPVLITSRTVSGNYGGAANGDGSSDIIETLYSSGQYRLGTFQLGSPTGLLNHRWYDSPLCTQLNYPGPAAEWNGDDYSNTYTAVKPTITGPGNSTSAAIWYLGGAPSIDGYYVQTTLTGNPNWSGAPSPSWNVIQRDDKLSLSANVANTVTVTSQGANAAANPPVYDYDVLVQINTGGLPSDPFPISINAPWSVFGYHVSDTNGPQQGYISSYSYLLYDVAGLPIAVPVTLHETIENCQIDYPQATWCGEASTIDTWTPADWDTTNPNSPQWVDKYYVYGIGRYPAPQNAQPGPLGATAVINKTQKWWIGAAGDLVNNPPNNVFVGMCVETNKIQYYTDHGEKQNVTTPIAPGGNGGNPVVTLITAQCAQGAFVNP